MNTRFVCFVSAVSLLVSSVVMAQPAGHSVKDGVYTAEQAERGQGVIGETCAKCHALKLTGGENNSPALAGDAFQNKWRGRSLGDLYQKMFATMPKENPGALAPEEYADAMAYILSVNKYPVGKDELTADITALKSIKIDLVK